MSKLEELIQQYCPDGVEWKPLKEVLKIKNGKDYKHLGEGDIPVYGSGGIMTYVNATMYDKPSVLIPRKGSIDKLYYVDTPFWNVDTVFYTEIDTSQVLEKYVFYVLQKEHLEKLNTAGGVPSLTQGVLNEVMIPLPPLPVQEEIVRILDNFTELQAELQAELQKRLQQYEYYRNSLLSFSKLPPPSAETQIVNWRKLGNVCNVFTGGEVPEESIKGDTPQGDMKYPIWGNGKEIYGYSNTYQIGQDAVCISSIGANTGTVFFHKAFFTPIIRLKVLIPIDEKQVSVRYLYHALTVIGFDVKKSSVPNMNSNEVKQKLVPVPSLAEQQRIVDILDRFDSLTNDLTAGLPAEIEKRKQQYEYYRDKLLTFKRLNA